MKHTKNFARKTIPLLIAVLISAGCDSDSVSDNAGGNGNETGAPTATISSSHTSIPRNDGNQTIITLDGSGSSDPDEGTLTYSWVVPSGTFVNGTAASDAIIQVTFPGLAPYTVELTVTDDDGLSDSASVTITVS